MQVIDVHVHAMPRGEMCGGEVDARLSTVLEGLAGHGIERAILVPINDISWQPVVEMNDFAERAAREHAGLEAFVDLDLSQAHYYQGIVRLEEDIARRHAQGLKGIKVHLQNLGLPASDWRLLPVYRIAGELGIPVMVHCHPGSAPGTIDNSSPIEIEKMVRAFHRTTFIVSHFGGLLYFAHMPWLSHENVYFETSGIVPQLMRYYGVDRVRAIWDEIGYDHILFGSDYPTVDLAEQIDAVTDAVPAEHHAAVFAGNALALAERFGWWA